MSKRSMDSRAWPWRLVWGVVLWSGFGAALAAESAAPLELQLDRAYLRVDSGEHSGPVTSIASTARGDFIVTASEDRTARVWDGSTLELVRTLRPPGYGVGSAGRLYTVAISPDGSLVATAGATHFSADGQQRSSEVYLFERSSGALLHTLPGIPSDAASERALRLCFSRDGQRLMVGRNRGGGTSIYEVPSGRTLIANFEPQRELIDADFDTGGRLLAVLARYQLKLLDRQLRPLAEVQLDDCLPRRARFSPDGTQVAVLCEQGARLLVRSAKDLKPRATLGNSPLDAETDWTGLVWSADGKALYTSGRRTPDGPGILQRWRLAARGGEPAGEPLVIADGRPTDLAMRPGGGVLFSAADQRWGVVDGAGQLVRAVGSAPYLAAHPDLLRIDQQGERVELALGPRQVLRFHVGELLLSHATSADETLRPPRTELPEHRITGWRGGFPTYLDDSVLLRDPELTTSLAAAPDLRGFLLGSSAHVSRFLLAQGDRSGCPVTDGWGRVPPCAQVPVDGALAVNWSGDGRYAVAVLRDGSVRWYAAGELREQLALYVHPDGKRWVLWQPSGVFAASVGGAELVGYHINRGAGEAAELFPLSRLRASRERPEIVSAALRAAAAPPPPVALRQVLPPVVRITAPTDGSSVSSPQVVLHVEVAALAEQKLTSLRVLVDGRLTTKLSGEGGPERDVTVTVPPHDCTLAVIAQSEAGSSTPALLRLRWTGPAPKPDDAAAVSARPRLIVLAVGVSAYQRSELRLTYPAKDARDLAALLTHARPGLYSAVETRVLTDDEATRKGILEGLEWLQRTAAPADTLVLMLAGHGITEAGSGQYYFLPVDAQPQSPLATMIAASALQQALATLPGRVVLLLDTCHAGGVLGGRRLRGLPDTGGVGRFINELGALEQGVVVLTAATEAQASQESAEWGNGAFTKALLEGLSGRADYGKTGRITVNMLDLYLSERVRELTQGAQTPATAKPMTIPDFPLVLTR